MISSKSRTFFIFFMISSFVWAKSPEEMAQEICQSARSKVEPLGLNSFFQSKLKEYSKGMPRSDSQSVYQALLKAAYEEAELYQLCACYELKGEQKKILENTSIQIKRKLAEHNHPESLKSLSLYYVEKENYADAQFFCNAYLRINPESVTGSRCMGQIMKKTKHSDWADAMFDCAAHQGDAYSLYTWGMELCETGRDDVSRRKGLQYIRTLAQKDTFMGSQAKTYLYKHIYKLYGEKGDPELKQEADTALYKAAYGEYADPEAQEILGQKIYYENKRFNQAEALLQKATKTGSLSALLSMESIYLDFASRSNIKNKEEIVSRFVSLVEQFIQKTKKEPQKVSEGFRVIRTLRHHSCQPDSVGIVESQLYWELYNEKKEKKYLEEAINAIKGSQHFKRHYLAGYYWEEKEHSAEAFEEYLNGDHLGDARASHRLGVVYRDGLLGQSKDLEVSKMYFQKAADLGYAESYLSLAYIDVLKEKKEEMLDLIKEASDLFLFEFDNSSPGFEKGSSLRSEAVSLNSSTESSSGPSGPDDSEMFANFLKAAELGNAHAQAKVGYHFAFKAKNAKKKERSKEAFSWQEKAFFWLQKAAEQKERFGLLNLGNHYIHGIGCTKNLKKALECYLRAASGQESLIGYNKGIALLACQYIGSLFEEEIGEAKNPFPGRQQLNLSVYEKKEAFKAQPALAAFYYQRCYDGILFFYTLDSSMERRSKIGMNSMPQHLKQAGARSAAALGHMYFRKSAGETDEALRDIARKQAREFYESAITFSSGDPDLEDELRAVKANCDMIDGKRINIPRFESPPESPFPQVASEKSSSGDGSSLASSDGSMEGSLEGNGTPRSSDSYKKRFSPMLVKTSTFRRHKGKQESLLYLDPQGDNPNASAASSTLPASSMRLEKSTRSSWDLSSWAGLNKRDPLQEDE